MRKKIRAITLIAALFIVSFCGGCGEKDGWIPTKSMVKSKVSKAVEKEKYSYERYEDIESEVPTRVYYFKSDERDMEFTAVATRTKGWMLGPAENYYEPIVEVNYDDGVKEYYQEQIINVLSKSDLYDAKTNAFVIMDEDDTEEIFDLLVEANKIYSQEEQYNTEKWMEDHPVLMVRVDMEKEGERVSGWLNEITGTKGKDEVADDISQSLKYIEKWM